MGRSRTGGPIGTRAIANARAPLWVARAAALGVVLFAPSVAGAQQPPPVMVGTPPPVVTPPPGLDTVVLRNGGLLRGRIQEILPGDHLTIAVDTGELRLIPWTEVGRVVVAASTKITPPSAPPAPAPPAPEPPPPPMRGPLVWVHIASPKHVTLNRRLDESGSWAHACDSPCDVELPIADEYEIAGLGNGPTKAFRLNASAGQSVVLSIEPPSIGGIVLGGALVLLGGVALYISAIVGVGIAAACTDEKCGTNGGYVAAAVSGGAMAAGGIIIYLSATTDINQHESVPTPARARDTTWLREPVWHTPIDPVPVSTPAFIIPIFSRSF
jgi:hypothetical protein